MTQEVVHAQVFAKTDMDGVSELPVSFGVATAFTARSPEHDTVNEDSAALFSVHPLQVEPVAWITLRRDVLSTFFHFSHFFRKASKNKRLELSAAINGKPGSAKVHILCGLFNDSR